VLLPGAGPDATLFWLFCDEGTDAGRLLREEAETSEVLLPCAGPDATLFWLLCDEGTDAGRLLREEAETSVTGLMNPAPTWPVNGVLLLLFEPEPPVAWAATLEAEMDEMMAWAWAGVIVEVVMLAPELEVPEPPLLLPVVEVLLLLLFPLLLLLLLLPVFPPATSIPIISGWVSTKMMAGPAICLLVARVTTLLARAWLSLVIQTATGPLTPLGMTHWFMGSTSAKGMPPVMS